MEGRPIDETFVGVLSRRGRFATVEPLFERGRRLTVDVRRQDAAIGDIVLVRSTRGDRAVGRAKVVRSLGRPDVARDVIEALLVDRSHARRFPARVEEEASGTATAEDRLQRRDLTGLSTFTIDPAQAKDFDDAISVEPEDGSFRLYVHIADVAAHVKPGSALDGEARERGNSVYAPGTVEPMLPEALSSHACSLVPGEPRRTVTVEMAIDPAGEVGNVAFYRSLIRSDRRLTYEEVDLVFADEAPPPDPVGAPLERARQIAGTLRERRARGGALELETSEPEFEFDSEGKVVRAIDDVQTEAHGVIEELMILANEQVAGELSRRRKPTLYRVHEPPDPEAVEALAAQLETLDVPTPPIPDHMTPTQAGEMAGAIGATVAAHIRRTGRGRMALTSLVLRSLKPAYYSPRNVGHAGLASEAYTHFTSPIRRYPDLVVHRALLATVGTAEQPAPGSELGDIGSHCSQTEREAMVLERDADDICLAFLLERTLFEEGWEHEFEGEVAGLVGGGAFVSFLPRGKGTAPCDGFLPVRRIGGDYYDLNEERTALVGRRTERRVRLADSILVKVRSIDAPRGRVELEPAG